VTPAEALRIARVGNVQVNQLRTIAGQQAARVWRTVGNVDDAAADAFVTRMVPLSAALERQAAEVTRAYLAAYAETALKVDIAEALATRGTPAVEVWRRPVVVARTALAEGKTWQQAMTMAGARASGLAETNVALAARSAGSQGMRALGAVGYRRVPDGQACELCLIAATQRYHIEQLMPLHDRCGCTVAPILGAKDPGRVIERDAAARLKASGAIDERTMNRRVYEAKKLEASDRKRAAHWREQARTTTDQQAETRYAKRADEWEAKANARAARVDEDRRTLAAIREGRLDRLTAVHEHGELGPVLTPAGDAFTGPAGITA
jgi:hypothetical protein